MDYTKLRILNSPNISVNREMVFLWASVWQWAKTSLWLIRTSGREGHWLKSFDSWLIVWICPDQANVLLQQEQRKRRGGDVLRELRGTSYQERQQNMAVRERDAELKRNTSVWLLTPKLQQRETHCTTLSLIEGEPFLGYTLSPAVSLNYRGMGN